MMRRDAYDDDFIDDHLSKCRNEIQIKIKEKLVLLRLEK